MLPSPFAGDRGVEINVSQDSLVEVSSGIEATNTFLSALSPDAVTSGICTSEIEPGVQPHQRLVPVVWKDADDVH